MTIKKDGVETEGMKRPVEVQGEMDRDRQSYWALGSTIDRKRRETRRMTESWEAKR
jgi:hypothetical protein